MMKKSSAITEREVAAGLAAELDKVIQQGGTPFDKATVEHRAGSLYPDITIWTNYQAQCAFAFWELKAPGRREDLSKLPAKAQMLGVRYVVVWNFQSGELYEVKEGQLYSIKSYPVPVLNSLEEWAIVPKRIAVVNQAKEILDDLARLACGESLTPYAPDKFYFIGILQKAIHNLVPVLQEHIFQKKKDPQIRARLDRWTVEQGYPTGLPDLDALLARHWAYSLAVRILFYFTVRRYYSGLPDLRPDTPQPIAELLRDAFSKAQAVDWQAVFELSPLDELGLPSKADPILRELLEDFCRYDFGLLKEDVIGQIMEGLIPEEERHALGQYFTREDLVDFIIGFVAHRDEAYYLDPTCGSGTFLNRLYSRLRWLSGYHASHSQLLERLWGIDVAHFPAELATINLFRQDVKDLTNFPRIIVSDFFQVRPGQTFSFPPLKVTTPDCPKIQVTLPLFDGIVGNFPYIRQELIERQFKGYKQKIVQAIAQEWFWKDRSLFEVKGIRDVELQEMVAKPDAQRRQWLQQQVQNGRVDLRLSGQADIYAYLFYHAAAFLKEGGRLGIVTSNAWLDVAYGEELKRFFLRHFKIIAVVASWCEPWFEDAAINTAFVILERCENAEERARHVVRFVKVKRPLSELLPRDLLLEEVKRWQKVDALVREIETADAQITGQGQPLRGVHTVETENFRIRLVPQAELEAELRAKGETAKWGLYIRAPQVYFDILAQAGDKLVPLSQVAEVRFGIKTGINDFFYLEPSGPGSKPGTVRVKNARGWIGEIEEECLRPVIRSPRESLTPSVDPARLRYRLFLPPCINHIAEKKVEAFRQKLKNKKLREKERRRQERELYEQLRKTLEQELQNKYPLAYGYVQWGENQRTSEGRLWPEVPSVQGRWTWWLPREATTPDGMWPKAFNDRFLVADNSAGVASSDRFYELVAKKGIQRDLLVAVLNSTVVFLIVETNGRVNLGEGAMDNMVYEVDQCMVPNPRYLGANDIQRILSAYNKLKHRPIQPIAEEVKQKDRRALDKAVLEALGLDPKVYLPKIYQGLVEMVRERLALPKLRTARKKQEKRLSLEQVKEKVRQEVLPGGLKPITAFLPAGNPPMMDVPLVGRPVSWSAVLTEYTLLDADGNEVGKIWGDEYQARYAVYAARPEEYMVQVPVDPIVAGGAVQKYEQYLRREAQKLFQRLLEATHDHRQADRIQREILESLDLPPLAIREATRA
jgi:hypothetical protein